MIPLWKKYGIGLAAILGILFIYSMYLLTENRHGSFDTVTITTMACAVCGMGLCVMLLLTLLMDTKINLGAVYFIALIVVNFFSLLSTHLEALFTGYDGYVWLITITEYVNPALLYSTMVIFWMYIGYITGTQNQFYSKLEMVFVVIFMAGLLPLLINLYTGDIFTVTKNATVIYGPLKPILLMPTFFMMIVGLIGVQVLVSGRRKKLALMIFLLAPFTSIILDLGIATISTINIIYCLALLIIYGNFYVGRSRELILKDAELLEQRAKILISQIQPHFLYNSLTSIMNIEGNPPATREAISDFGLYLRGNLDTLKQTGPITLMRELDHVETFIILQKLELGDRLQYETDLKVKDILLPAQTIQILVEYCIEYGLRGLGHGTIFVKSWIAGPKYVIIVAHDGKRFDVSDLNNSGKSNLETVTFGNVRDRLADTVGGEIELFRRDGGGNLFRILIPIPKMHRSDTPPPPVVS